MAWCRLGWHVRRCIVRPRTSGLGVDIGVGMLHGCRVGIW